MRGRRIGPPILIVLVAMVLAGDCAAGQDDEEGPTFVSDWTPSEGTTGDDLPVLVRVTDPSGVFTVHIRYRFEGETEVSAPMSSDHWEENWSFQLKLRSKPVNLQYSFRAQDKVGNWAESEVRFVSLRDDDPPRCSLTRAPVSRRRGRRTCSPCTSRTTTPSRAHG